MCVAIVNDQFVALLQLAKPRRKRNLVVMC